MSVVTVVVKAVFHSFDVDGCEMGAVWLGAVSLLLFAAECSAACC